MALSQLSQFMDAIAKKESGGESDPYRARGPAEHPQWGRAMGKYQMMSGIWPSWAAEIGYDGLTQQQFLDNPHVQDAIAAHKMTQYYNKYGDWSLVAAAWFGGQGTANEIQRKGMDAVAGRTDGFTAVPAYVNEVMGYFGPADTDVSRGDTVSQPLTSLDVVKQAMQGIEGLTVTSTYRDPDKNKSVGGSDTSLHLNEGNPAVDVSGPRESMAELARRLDALGYDAEMLWDTDGHYDHVHYALRSQPGVNDRRAAQQAGVSQEPIRSQQRNTVQAMMNKLSEQIQRDPSNIQLHQAAQSAMQRVMGRDPGKASITQSTAETQQRVKQSTDRNPEPDREFTGEVATVRNSGETAQNRTYSRGSG